MKTSALPAPAPGREMKAPRGLRSPRRDAPSARRGSAIYEGWVSHRRTAPMEHAFRYRIFLPLFDLDELPALLDDVPLWSARGRAPARFRRSDYMGDPAAPLAESARDLVAERTGSRPEGPVRLLANPRYWGVGFNPVAFYFLYGKDPAAGAEAMIAEVTNTPWGQRRSYVLESVRRGSAGASPHACTSRPSFRSAEPSEAPASPRAVASDPNSARVAAVSSIAVVAPARDHARRDARLLFRTRPDDLDYRRI